MSAGRGPILAINSGSSTLKFGLFTEEGGEEKALAKGGADGIGKDTGKLEILEGEDKSLHSDHTPIGSQQLALSRINDELKGLGFPQPVAIGHRIVHGGPRLRDHVRITPDVIAALEASVHFAPVHIPTSLELIRHTENDLPQVGAVRLF